MFNVTAWAIQIGRALIEVAIACVLVTRTEGLFQTSVVCLLGLIFERVRLSLLEARTSGELIGFSITRTAFLAKERADTVEQMERSAEQFQRSINEQIRSMVTPESTVMNIEGWILRIVFVLALLNACLTSIG